MLEEEIVRLGAFEKGDFTLTSGRKSNFYIDLRVAITKPDFLEKVAVDMSQRLGFCKRIAAVELGAVPLAAAISLETGIPYLMVRKARKEHGAGKTVEGDLEAGEKVFFVEDTVTTGSTLIRGIEAVRELGGVVDTALVIVDREEGAKENLAAIGVNLISLASIDRLRELAGV